MPGKLERSHLNSFQNLCREILVHFHTHSEVIPENSCALQHSFGSYAGKPQYTSTLIWKLCQETPVHFHSHSEVMPKNPCTFPYSLEGYVGKSLYTFMQTSF